MNMKSLLARPFAGLIAKQIRKGMDTAVEDQEKILKQLIDIGQKTDFGNDHKLKQVSDYQSFIQAVPVRDYEQLKPYIEAIKTGKHNVLWKGKPVYFAKTSGTTSGVKYIPITKDSIPNHINSARNALLNYMYNSGNYNFANGKMIFLSGSPELERVADIPTGRLSGIVNHHVPKYLRTNQLPSYETNCMDVWESKLDKIVEETVQQNMTLISGIPPWMQMYFDRLVEKSGKNVGELFPQLSVLVHGGVNFEPYKSKLFKSIGRNIDAIETFPASEGFFAFQDSQDEAGLLLNTNSGIYYEFVPLNEISLPNPTRCNLSEVKIGENYALILNSNAGLWGYNLGDTIRFVSLKPYRIVVTGRIKQYLSASGEHVIAEEVEHVITKASTIHGAYIKEFTVAPVIANAQHAKGFHEWFIEFEKYPDNMEAFAVEMDQLLRQKNVYYDDLIGGNILNPLKITEVRRNGFLDYLRSVGRLGGQNKVPRLSNDRKIANELKPFLSKEGMVNV